jgi:Fe-S cluster assembly iron-binding protein IscA
LALDEPKESDEVFDREGVGFVIEKKLLEDVQPVTIDYVTTPSGEGFTIDSGLKSDDGCGSCSTC